MFCSRQKVRSLSVRLNSTPEMGSGKRAPFEAGRIVPETGIYRVTHAPDHLPHEVIILKGEHFPRSPNARRPSYSNPYMLPLICSRILFIASTNCLSLTKTHPLARPKLLFYTEPICNASN